MKKIKYWQVDVTRPSELYEKIPILVPEKISAYSFSQIELKIIDAIDGKTNIKEISEKCKEMDSYDLIAFICSLKLEGLVKLINGKEDKENEEKRSRSEEESRKVRDIEKNLNFSELWKKAQINLEEGKIEEGIKNLEILVNENGVRAIGKDNLINYLREAMKYIENETEKIKIYELVTKLKQF